MSIAKFAPVIRGMEKRGAPILGMTYTNREGVQSERDIQICVNRGFSNPLPHGNKVSKCLVQHNGNVYVQAIDRNRALNLRRLNPTMTREEADRQSFRAFRLDRVISMRYGKKELGL